MSKIEKYKEQTINTKYVKEDLYQAIGYYPDGTGVNPRNDKNMIYVKYTGKHSDNWGAAQLYLHASYGFYGSSSGYSAINERVAPYMEKAINKHITQIVKTAIKLAEEDAEKARLEAEEEAKEVLLMISK